MLDSHRMDRLVYYNDRIVDATEAKIASTLGGALYGWGVFTTLRISEGKIFALDHHWERLIRHAEKARVPVPIEYEELKSAVYELIAANSTRQGRARITILKGEIGSW